MIRIVQATTDHQLDLARTILREFPDHQREHYADHLHIVDRYFDDMAYAKELLELGSIYGRPRGCVLIGYADNAPAGAICLRGLDAAHCEMKRLYVRKKHRRRGLARALVEALLKEARAWNYQCMRLDTGTFMMESQALYRSLGFRYMEPYYAVRDDLRDGLVYMELPL